MTTIENQCIYCHRIYRKKENYEKHAQCCEFFHRARQKKSHDEQMDSYDIIPSPREMFQLLKELAYRNARLEEEVAKLRQSTSVKQRNIIQSNLQCVKPALTGVEWSKTFTVDMSDLESVFEYDLTQGIKHCIKRNIGGLKTLGGVLPIAYFEQKQHNLYLYDYDLPQDKDVVEPPKWQIANQYHLDKIVSILSMKFLQYFMAWQRDYLENNKKEDEDTMKNKLIVYMMKINSVNSQVDRRRNEVKRVLQEMGKTESTFKTESTKADSATKTESSKV